ncbi:putative bifunctional diguanylate cyclase/phosphodiesterase [Lichenicola sp.]|uniref:putative bifunctional diguanylate cyclase/phosphodiesterase n=1 Tax=Lichenicola sp. TaxID=2804529 RepID=UPI003B00F0C0
MSALDDAVAMYEELAVLLCDIDHFKMVNDRFGHLAGDEVLVAFAGALATNIGPGEAVGRYGGEEFLLILPGDADAVMLRVSAICLAMTEASGHLGGLDWTVTSSGGLAFLRTGDTSLSLLARADTALYLAKANGRNRIEHDRAEAADRPARRAEDRLAEDRVPCATGSGTGTGKAGQPARACDLERDLRAALARGEFTLLYQPIVDINRDMVTGWEALLRWQSPLRGDVPPGDFIPFAESVGLMPEIGDWVLRAACREAVSWQDATKLSVNLSPTQFRLPDLVDRIRQILAETGLPPERLELEITETAMIDNIAGVGNMLRQLRALGITIALDDFGTGYSSLSFLRMLPFDRIKIDRSFVQDLGVRPQAVPVLRALVGLCVSVGAAATAEGAETDQQIALLRAAGCVEVQGFRIGHPCPASEMQAWMADFVADRALAPAA